MVRVLWNYSGFSNIRTDRNYFVRVFCHCQERLAEEFAQMREKRKLSRDRIIEPKIHKPVLK